MSVTEKCKTELRVVHDDIRNEEILEQASGELDESTAVLSAWVRNGCKRVDVRRVINACKLMSRASAKVARALEDHYEGN